MSQMHESMVQKLDVRHLDMTEELADIEKKSGEEVMKKEDQWLCVDCNKKVHL